MLLALYFLCILSLGMSGIVDTYFGWFILCLSAIVSYMTSTFFDFGKPMMRRCFIGGVGFVLLATTLFVGMSFMQEGSPELMDYALPLLLVFAHSARNFVFKEQIA